MEGDWQGDVRRHEWCGRENGGVWSEWRGTGAEDVGADGSVNGGARAGAARGARAGTGVDADATLLIE
jgi:hypothetical protein